MYNPVHPKLVLHVRPQRVMMPKLAVLALFAAVIYAIVVVNNLLLGVEVQAALHVIIATSFVVLLALETLWTYVKFHSMRYEFYSTHLLVRGPHTYRVDYSEISTMSPKKGFFDRMMGTHTIALVNPSHRYFVRYVPDDARAYSSMEQLVYSGKGS